MDQNDPARRLYPGISQKSNFSAPSQNFTITESTMTIISNVGTSFIIR